MKPCGTTVIAAGMELTQRGSQVQEYEKSSHEPISNLLAITVRPGVRPFATAFGEQIAGH